MPESVLRAKAEANRDAKLEWYEKDTRVYRIMAVAEEWRIRPTEFLRWTRRERMLAETYLIAKGLKQEAMTEAQKRENSDRGFDARLQNWGAELAKQSQMN